MSQYLNNIDKFRFLAYKILPLVYDDSLSYYEFCDLLITFLRQFFALIIGQK